MQTTVIWPEIFIEANYEYPYPTDQLKERAVADGLEGWALCMAGNEHPESFGQGMAKISSIIGESATPENLKKLADEILETKPKPKKKPA